MNPEIRERIELVRRGEVPEGYKQKEHRLFPKGWHYDKLGKHLLAYDELSSETNSYPIATSSRQGLMLQTEYYNDQRYEDTTGGFHVVPEGYVTYRHMSDDDIFHLNINELGQSVLVSPEYPVFTTTPDMVQALVVNYINEMEVFRTFSAAQKKGSTRTRMYFHRLCEFSLPIPPLQEQQKIAEILACCEKAIVLERQFIAEKRRQKASLMQKLLDPNSGVRLPGFEGSKWTKSTIGTLFEIGSSLSVPREQLSDDGIPYLHYGDVHSNRTGIVDIEKDGIPKLRTENVQERFFLDDGDVVFVDASEDYDGVSKYVVIRNAKGRPFLAGLHTLPAHSKTDALSFGFKRYCFMPSKIKKQFAFYASGMKVLGLNKVNLSKIEIEYPSLKEQTAIAGILSAADCEIDLLEQELEAWQQKRKALMQLLLTGLVRV